MSYRSRVVWNRDPANLGRTITEYGEKLVYHALVQYLEKMASKIQAQMQREAESRDPGTHDDDIELLMPSGRRRRQRPGDPLDEAQVRTPQLSSSRTPPTLAATSSRPSPAVGTSSRSGPVSAT